MSKNTIVLNNAEEFKNFTEDRVLRAFAKKFIDGETYHIENMMEAISFYVSFKTVNTPKESSFPITFKVNEYNSMLVINGVDKTPLHRGGKFIENEFDKFMEDICSHLEYDATYGIIKTGEPIADQMVVETFFCYERIEKPKPKVMGLSNKDMEIVGNLQEGEKVIPNEPFKVSIKDKTITVKVSKGYVVNVESM